MRSVLLVLDMDFFAHATMHGGTLTKERNADLSSEVIKAFMKIGNIIRRV